MNPQYIYISGVTFYFLTKEAEMRARGLAELPALSYEAMHMNAFGHVDGQPCRAGASYGKHFAVNGLYKLAGG